MMGRVDDIINVSGHRISTGQMEEIISNHQNVAECAVIGVYDDIKGEVPVACVVLKTGAEVGEEEMRAELVGMVREEIGPVAALKKVMIVKMLPKTRSGKILRATMKAIAHAEEFSMPATIENEEALDEVRSKMKSHGLAVKPVIKFETFENK